MNVNINLDFTEFGQNKENELHCSSGKLNGTLIRGILHEFLYCQNVPRYSLGSARYLSS